MKKYTHKKSVRAYEQENHIMTLDMGKEIAMIQRTDAGKNIRRYFIEIEKQYTKEKIENSERDRTSKNNINTDGLHIIKSDNTTWGKDLNDSINIMAIRHTDSYPEKVSYVKGIFHNIYNLVGYKTGKDLRLELKKIKKEAKKEGRATKTVNVLDYTQTDDTFIDATIRGFNTIARKNDTIYRISFNGEIKTLVTPGEKLKLKSLQELVALQDIIEGSGNTTPKDYKLELKEFLKSNEELLEMHLNTRNELM